MFVVGCHRWASNINLDGASLKNPLDISEDWDVRETKILGHDILTNARMKEECLQEL